MTFPSKKLLSVKDISEYLQVTPAAVYKWVKEDTMPAPMRLGVGSRSMLRWSPDTVNAWLEERSGD
jgi:excisionase family DNA binding protein